MQTSVCRLSPSGPKRGVSAVAFQTEAWFMAGLSNSVSRGLELPAAGGVLAAAGLVGPLPGGGIIRRRARSRRSSTEKEISMARLVRRTPSEPTRYVIEG